MGAKNWHILFQFLFEAIFLTFLGGIGGVLIGIGVSKVGEILASRFGFSLNFSVTWWSLAIRLGFSSFTGIVFGYFPARKASQLSPMEALRKE